MKFFKISWEWTSITVIFSINHTKMQIRRQYQFTLHKLRYVTQTTTARKGREADYVKDKFWYCWIAVSITSIALTVLHNSYTWLVDWWVFKILEWLIFVYVSNWFLLNDKPSLKEDNITIKYIMFVAIVAHLLFIILGANVMNFKALSRIHAMQIN